MKLFFSLLIIPNIWPHQIEAIPVQIGQSPLGGDDDLHIRSRDAFRKQAKLNAGDQVIGIHLGTADAARSTPRMRRAAPEYCVATRAPILPIESRPASQGFVAM